MADRKGAKGGQGRDKLRPRRSAEFGFSEEAKRPPEQTEEAGRAKGAPGHGPAKGVPRPGGSKKGPKPRSASLPRSGPGYNEAMETLPRDLAEPAAPIPPEEVSRGSEARPTEGRGGEGSEGRRRPRYEQPSGTLRLFAAAPLPLTLKRDLVFYQTALLKNPRQLKVVKPENLHITLHFLGDTPLEQIDAFKASLTEVAAAQAPFRIEIGGAAAFPGSIVIPVVGGRVELVAMGMALRNTAARLGLKTDAKPINPHVTIARLRDRQANPNDFIEEDNAEEAYAWTCQSIVLYESRLKPEGPDYIELARYPLGGPGG